MPFLCPDKNHDDFKALVSAFGGGKDGEARASLACFRHGDGNDIPEVEDAKGLIGWKEPEAPTPLADTPQTPTPQTNGQEKSKASADADAQGQGQVLTPEPSGGKSPAAMEGGEQKPYPPINLPENINSAEVAKQYGLPADLYTNGSYLTQEFHDADAALTKAMKARLLQDRIKEADARKQAEWKKIVDSVREQQPPAPAAGAAKPRELKSTIAKDEIDVLKKWQQVNNTNPKPLQLGLGVSLEQAGVTDKATLKKLVSSGMAKKEWDKRHYPTIGASSELAHSEGKPFWHDDPQPESAGAAPEAKKPIPSLGDTGKDIWQKWKNRIGIEVMPGEVVEARDIHNGGVYGWYPDGLMRIERSKGKNGWISTNRPATKAEIDGLHDSLDRGALQIESRRITGAGGEWKREDSGDVKSVLHQATGKPLAEFLDTPEGKKWQARYDEDQRTIAAKIGALDPAPDAPTQREFQQLLPGMGKFSKRLSGMKQAVEERIAQNEKLPLSEQKDTGRLEDLLARIERKMAAEKPAATIESAPVKPAEKPVAEPPKGITDFGEKIGGARKDKWKERGLVLGDLGEMTDEERQTYVNKHHVFGAFDYESLVEQGMPPAIARIVKTIKDKIGLEPDISKKRTDETQEQFVNRVRMSQAKYVQLVGKIRDQLKGVRSLEDIKAMYKGMFPDDPTGRFRTFMYGDNSANANLIGDNNLISAMQPSKYDMEMAEREVKKSGWPSKEDSWKRRFRVDERPAGSTIRIDDQPVVTDKPTWTVSTTAKRGWGHTLKNGFESEAEAIAYIKNEAMKGDAAGTRITRPYNPDLKRVGPEVDRNENVTEDDFGSAFGFRGGEFGKWTNDADRQQSLNQAYDGLMDLARILGVPPKSLSLNGALGIGFGSRGGGWAAAHYESGKVVINLTKTRGAGTLSHEWAHALDDHFGKIATGKIANWLSHAPKNGDVRPEVMKAWADVMRVITTREASTESAVKTATEERDKSVRYLNSWLKEIETQAEKITDPKAKEAVSAGMAMLRAEQPMQLSGELAKPDAVVAAMNAALKGAGQKGIDAERKKGILNNADWLAVRNRTLEKAIAGEIKRTEDTDIRKWSKERGKSADNYWNRLHELFARSFESYAAQKIEDAGESSPYLVQGVPTKKHAFLEWEDAYPRGRDAEAIHAEFQKLFDVIEAVPTDKGVTLHTSKLPAPLRADDTRYLDLAKDPEKNRDELQRMVDERAKAAGYTERVFHGTTKRKPTTLLPSFEAGDGIFTTDNPDVAQIFRYERDFGDVITERYDEETGEYEDVEPGALLELNIKPGKQLDLSKTDVDPQDFVMDTSLQTKVLKKAIADGYDSILIPDVDEGVGDWMEHGSTTVLFKSNQLKSADPITRDAQGNVILLSERFNPNEDSILRTSELPKPLRADSPEWKAMTKEERAKYLKERDGATKSSIRKIYSIPEGALKRELERNRPFSEEAILNSPVLRPRMPQRIGIDSLSEETKNDIVSWISENVPDAGDESDVRNNLIGLADEPKLSIRSAPIDDIEVSPVRQTSKLAVDKYSKMKGDSAPPIIVNGTKLLEGGNRLAAAKRRGDKSVRVVDIAPLANMDWKDWMSGGKKPDSLQASPLPAREKITNLIEWASRGTEPGKEAKEGLQRLMLPTALSKEHLDAAVTLGSKLGGMNRRQEAATAIFKPFSKMFVKLGVHDERKPFDKNAGIKFMSDRSTGKPMSPEMEKVNKLADEQDAIRIKLLDEAGVPLQTIRENYFPGVWTRASRRAFNLAMDQARKEGIIKDGDTVNTATADQKAWVKARVEEHLKNSKGMDGDSAFSYLTKSPMHGKQGFRKQKEFNQDILTAFEFGLKPESYNPVDQMKLKWAEMDRNIMAAQAFKAWAKEGKLRVIKPFEKTPDGWVEVNDRYGKVWSGPNVPVWKLLQELAKTAKKDLYFADFAKDIFGDPDLKDEMNDLKWTKKDGSEIDIHAMHYATGKSYSQLIVEKLLENHDEFKRYAAGIYGKLEAISNNSEKLRQILDMPTFNDLKQRLPLEGPVLTGRRIVPTATGDIINNYLSKNLYDNPYFGKLYKGWMGLANALNQAQLGVGSAFHAGFTTAEAIVSSNAIVLKDIFGVMRGNRTMADLGRSVKDAIMSPVETARIMLRTGSFGDDILNAWRNPDGVIDPKIKAIVQAVELAGGGFTMERGLETQQHAKLMQDWYGGNKLMAAARSPIAAIEMLAAPIMHGLVPRQKAGVFAQLAQRIIDQNPGKALEDLAPQFRQAWNRVDARLGQVRYDRLFINGVAKNVIQGVIRAPGWTGGTIAELGGSFKDTYNFLKEWKDTGKLPANMPDRVAYTLSLLVSIGTANALLTYLMTGDKPAGLDYWAFRTGGLDESGRAERMVLPTYMKDLLAYKKEFWQTLRNKTHPILSVVGDLYKNKDYYGVEIRHEDDGIPSQIAQSGKYMAKAFTPFWMRGVAKERARGGNLLEQALPQIGVMPAPKKMTQSPAEAMVDEFAAANRPQGSRTQEQADASAAKGKIIRDLRQHKPADMSEAIQKGQVKRRDIADLKRRSMETAFAYQVSHMPLDQAQKIYKVATPEEQQQIRRIIVEKMKNARSQQITTS